MRLGNVTGSLNAPVPAFASPLPSVTDPFHSTSTCRSKVAIAASFLICRGAPPPRPVPSRLMPLGLACHDYPLSGMFNAGPHPRRLCLRGLRRSALLATTIRLVRLLAGHTQLHGDADDTERQPC